MLALRGQSAKQATCTDTKVTRSDGDGPEESGSEPQVFPFFSLEQLW